MKVEDKAVRFEGEKAYILQDGVNLTTDLVNHWKEVHVSEGVRKAGSLRFSDVHCDVYLPSTLDYIQEFVVAPSAKVAIHFPNGNQRFLEGDPSILFAKPEGKLFYSSTGTIPAGAKVIGEGALDGYEGKELRLPESVEEAYLDFKSMKARSLYFDSLIRFHVSPVAGLKVFLGKHAGFGDTPFPLDFDDEEGGYCLDGENQYYYPLDGILVRKEDNALLFLPATKEIPPFVKRIETGAIAGKGRRELLIPDSVAEVDCYAIGDTPNLERLHLGKGVERFGRWAIEAAPNLAYFSVSEDNPYYFAESNCLIRKEGMAIVLGGKESVIPSAAKSIAAGAFLNPPADFLIPSSIEYLDPGDGFDIEPAVKGGYFHSLYLDTPCFDGLSIGDVDTLTLGPNFPQVKKGEFRGQIHGKVKEVVLEGDNSGLSITSGNGLIDGAGVLLAALDGFSFTPEVKGIGYRAFAGSELAELIVPKTVSYLAKGAFDWMMSLRRLLIPGSIPVIPEFFLSFCPNLEEIVLEEGVRKLERCAFSELHGLKRVHLPASLTDIAPWQFVCCPNIAHIEVPSDGHFRFLDGYDCLIEKENAEAVFAFGRLRLPEGIKSIKEDAMREYQEGFPLVIPASVEKLGKGVGFEASFKSLEFKGNKVKAIPESAFAYARLGEPFFSLPEGVEEIGGSAFIDTPIESLRLPSTLKRIGPDAFFCCGIEELLGGGEKMEIGPDAFGRNPIEILVQNNGQVGYNKPIQPKE